MCPSIEPSVPTFIDTNQFASLTGRSKRTVEHARLAGNGPPYYKLGRRVVYRLDEVLTWVHAQQRRSTSDPGRAE